MSKTEKGSAANSEPGQIEKLTIEDIGKIVDLDKINEMKKKGECLFLNRSEEFTKLKSKGGNWYNHHDYFVKYNVFLGSSDIVLQCKDISLYQMLEALFRIMPQVPLIREITYIENNEIVRFFVKVHDKINDQVVEIIMSGKTTNGTRTLNNIFNKLESEMKTEDGKEVAPVATKDPGLGI